MKLLWLCIILIFAVCISACYSQDNHKLSVQEEYVFDPKTDNQGYDRYSEGDIYKLRNGNIVFLFSCFKGKQDNNYGEICISYFKDGSWTVPSVFISNHANWNVMSPSLRAYGSGGYKLFYLAKNNTKDCQLVFVDLNEDLIPTSSPFYVTSEGFNVVNNDRVFINDKKIIIPVSRHLEDQGHLIPEGQIFLLESTDGGSSWLESKLPDKSNAILQEPGYFEDLDNRYLWVRSNLGSQLFYNFLIKKWEESEFLSPLSPMSVEYSKFGYIGVWNRLSQENLKGLRNPIVLFHAKKDMKEFYEIVLDDGVDGFFAYPSIYADYENKRVFVSYTFGNYMDGGWGAIKVSILN